MGTGTNIQNRVVHLLHMDAPWRPADVTQREGRAIRQGNQNPEVALTQMITEKSFDTFLWQTLERKAGFISQVMTSKIDVRQVEDVGGDDTLSFAQFKALSSGDPLMMEELQAKEDLTKLRRLEVGYKRNRAQLEGVIAAEPRIARYNSEISMYRDAARRSTSTEADRFQMLFRGTWYDKRKDALAAVQEFLFAGGAGPAFQLGLNQSGYRDYTVGKIGGHDLVLQSTPAQIVLLLQDAPRAKVTIAKMGATSTQHMGLITRLENLIPQIDSSIVSLQEERDSLTRRIEQAREDLDKPFKHITALEAAEERYAGVTARIQQQAHQDALSPAALELASVLDDPEPLAAIDPAYPAGPPVDQSPDLAGIDL